MASELCKACARVRNCINGLWCSLRRVYVEYQNIETCNDRGTEGEKESEKA